MITGIKTRSIMFDADSVRANRKGKKNQTRRIIRLPDDADEVRYWTTPSGRPQEGFADPGVNYWTPGGNHIDACPYGFPGDRLWVKEPTSVAGRSANGFRYHYKAGGNTDLQYFHWQDFPYKVPKETKQWGRGYPRMLSRSTLEITRIDVQRLHDIPMKDVYAEGIEFPTAWGSERKKFKPLMQLSGKHAPIDYYKTGDSQHKYVRAHYACRWDQLNAARGFPWSGNWWVWVISYKPIERAQK